MTNSTLKTYILPGEDDSTPWMNSQEATKYLKLPSIGALRFAVFKRQVPHYKWRRRLYFKKEDLDRLLERAKR